GSNLRERPHRYARIKLHSIPEDVELFGTLKKELEAFRQQMAKGAQADSLAKKTNDRRSPVEASGDGWDAATSNKVRRDVLEKSGLPFRSKPKGGDTFYEFQDCPYHDAPDGQTHECCVIVRADGSFAAKCMHDDTATWREQFKPKISWDEHIGTVL